MISFMRNKAIASLLIIMAVLFASPAHAQQQYGAGEFPIDTAACKLCDSVKYIPQYYSVHGKYPLSSEALVKKANATVHFPTGFSSNGYITIRFVVNCMGETNCFHIYEVDNAYKTTTFPKEVTRSLLDFVKQLGNWPRRTEQQKVNYYAYLTFRIQHGKITHIVP